MKKSVIIFSVLFTAVCHGGIFINSDAWNFWLNEPLETYDKAELMNAVKRDVDFYAVQGVEAVFYNMNFQRTFFKTKVGTPYWKDCSLGEDGTLLLRGKPIPSKPTEESPEPTYRTMYVRSKHMNELLPDFMALRYRYCHEKGIEMWHSMRMNDVHHSALGQEWRPQHSDLWLEQKDLLRAWYRHSWRIVWTDNAFDYGKDEVYRYHLAMVREYLMDYESDGIELDWLRAIPIFKPGYDEAGIKIMNRFMRETKAIAKEAERKWGHKIRIAVRVPGRVREALACGMDVHQWAKEKLFDVLIPSCNDTATEQDYDLALWRILAPKPIILAPDIDYSIRSGATYGWSMSYTKETDFGFASNFYQQGADTMYFYNHFPRHQKEKPFTREIFSTVADREKVANAARRHVVTQHHVIGEGLGAETTYPRWIWPGCCNGSTRINVGEKVAGRKAYVLIGVGVPLKIDILVNGEKTSLDENAHMPELPKNAKAKGYFVTSIIPEGQLHDGWNNIEIFNRDTENKHTLCDHEIIWMEIGLL